MAKSLFDDPKQSLTDLGIDVPEHLLSDHVKDAQIDELIDHYGCKVVPEKKDTYLTLATQAVVKATDESGKVSEDALKRHLAAAVKRLRD